MKIKLALFLFLMWCAFLVAISFYPSQAQAPPAAAGQKAYINSIATTMVKPTNGFLHTVTVNGGAAGTVSLFDIAASGCAGTPASGKFAAITIPATPPPVTLTYDVAAINGLCVVTSAATDVTVSYN